MKEKTSQSSFRRQKKVSKLLYLPTFKNLKAKRLFFCESETNDNSLLKSLCTILEKVFFKLYIWDNQTKIVWKKKKSVKCIRISERKVKEPSDLYSQLLYCFQKGFFTKKKPLVWNQKFSRKEHEEFLNVSTSCEGKIKCLGHIKNIFVHVWEIKCFI